MSFFGGGDHLREIKNQSVSQATLETNFAVNMQLLVKLSGGNRVWLHTI